MSKPKPIRRHGPNGAQELTQVLSPPATDQELLAACMELGQDSDVAADTVEMYREQILDPSDAALMEEMIREKRGGQLPQGMPFVREQPATINGKRVVRNESSPRENFADTVKAMQESVRAAHIDPRDPNAGLHKQRVTHRDSAGRVLRLDDV